MKMLIQEEVRCRPVLAWKLNAERSVLFFDDAPRVLLARARAAGKRVGAARKARIGGAKVDLERLTLHVALGHLLAVLELFLEQTEHLVAVLIALLRPQTIVADVLELLGVVGNLKNRQGT